MPRFLPATPSIEALLPLSIRQGYARTEPERLVLHRGRRGVQFFLMWAQHCWFWWPLHPIGMVIVGTGFVVRMIWFSAFVAWLLKAVILKFWGGKVFLGPENVLSGADRGRGDGVRRLVDHLLDRRRARPVDFDDVIRNHG